MEFHERMDIAHTLHTFWNPISDSGVDELVAALDLQPGQRVLDIACGPAELLCRIAQAYEITGIGVDLSRWAVPRARAAVQARAPGRIEIVDAEGAAYAQTLEERFDLTCLVGASWIWEGYAGTLRALHRLTKPNGLALFGEPYWKVDEPSPVFCEGEGVQPDAFTSLPGLQDIVQQAGFRLLYLRASTDDEWDRYEMLQSLATDRWAQANPDHPDRDEVLGLQDAARANYLRYGREQLGFAQMLLRKG